MDEYTDFESRMTSVAFCRWHPSQTLFSCQTTQKYDVILFVLDQIGARFLAKDTVVFIFLVVEKLTIMPPNTVTNATTSIA